MPSEGIPSETIEPHASLEPASSGTAPGAGAIEALALFAVIMAYIWKLRFTHPRLWLPALVLIVLSHFARHERAPALGFRTTGFGTCLRKFGPVLAGLALSLLGLGVWLGTIRPLGFEQALRSFALYLPWGLFQQYLLNGFFLRRFEMLLSQTGAGILASVLFGVVHTPNWFLMAVTLVGGYTATWIYRRHRNLYFLGFAHATIGFLLFFALPDSVSHHLNIGPTWAARP